MARYLVTGCAGFIGSQLAERLVDAGDRVLGVDSFSDYYSRRAKTANLAYLLEHERFELVEADLADAHLAPLLAGVDGVFHLAGQPGVRGSWGDSFEIYVRNNILASRRIFETAGCAGVRVVFASTSSVYGDAETYPTTEGTQPRPISPYGVTKLACESLAHAHARFAGLDCVTLRYFTVYGPRQRPDMAFTRIARALVDGGSFEVYGTGEQSRDVTYVDDAVSATVAAMGRGRAGAVYNVGGGTETSLREVIEIFESLTGRRLERRTLPSARGDVRRTSADTSRIRRELGWAPATSLEDGLGAQLEWACRPVRVLSAAVGR